MTAAYTHTHYNIIVHLIKSFSLKDYHVIELGHTKPRSPRPEVGREDTYLHVNEANMKECIYIYIYVVSHSLLGNNSTEWTTSTKATHEENQE